MKVRWSCPHYAMGDNNYRFPKGSCEGRWVFGDNIGDSNKWHSACVECKARKPGATVEKATKAFS